MAKIFVSGFTASQFISHLYSVLVKINSQNELYIVDGKKDLEWGGQILSKKETLLKNTFAIRDLLTLPLFKILKFLFFKIALGSKNPRTHFRFIKEQITTYFFAKYLERNSIDIVHIHTILPEYLWIVHYLSKKVKIVVSVWGSDLLRMSGVYNYLLTFNVLNKADIITVSNIQLREILLSKFGRNLSKKTKLNYFILDSRYFDIIDKNSFSAIDYIELKRHLKIAEDKQVILIGHSGDPCDQHLKILESLEGLPGSLKEKFVFVLPLSYALTEEYERKLLNFRNSSSLKIIFQKEFLSVEDLVKLRLTASVAITLPVSDADSGFLKESLYAGCKCITGAWLPYGRMKRLGLPFYEIEDFKELLDTFLFVVDSPGEFDMVFMRNVIRKEYLSTETVYKWNEILS